MWSFVEEDTFIYVLSDGKKSVSVSDVQPLSKKNHVEVAFVEGLPGQYNLEKFLKEGEFSQKFAGTTRSRQLFCQTFKDSVKELRENESHQERDQEDSNSGREDEEEEEQGPINSSSQEVLQTVPSTTDYLHEKKIIDQCVEVHVLNLVQPNQRRRAREMDTSHVKFLEESFLKSPGGEFNLLAGLLLKGSLEQVGNEGGATVEVIGGNHTRAALTSLYRRGLRSPLVRVRLYGDLTDEEALHIGYNHNELATRSKKMSFTDKAEIVRKIIQLHPNNSRKKLADFFGYEKGAPEAKNKLTVHIRLASLPEEVFELVKQCEKAFDQKNPLSQATIRGIMWKPMEEMMTALTELRDNGLKAYKAYLKSLKPVSEPVEEQTTSGSQKQTSEDAKIEKLKNQVKELQSKCKALEDKVMVLEDENKKLRDEQENNDDVIAPTPDVSFGVEVNDDDDREKENSFMESLSLTKRSKRVSDKETSSSPLQAKKRRLNELPILPEREDFQEGEVVEALWDDGHYYEAKIIKTLKNGTFKVQYTMDKKKKNVEEKAMKKT